MVSISKWRDQPIGQYHQNKEIDSAIQTAVENGWHWKPSKKGHCKGRLLCNLGHRNHMFSVWSTPDVPEHEAEKIRRKTSKCPE